MFFNTEKSINEECEESRQCKLSLQCRNKKCQCIESNYWTGSTCAERTLFKFYLFNLKSANYCGNNYTLNICLIVLVYVQTQMWLGCFHPERTVFFHKYLTVF